jgi:hypothetical protein|tara:strand:- start:372 stop:1295 length:924 start_codon:yes stop_codon:yes gene_type:complete
MQENIEKTEPLEEEGQLIEIDDAEEKVEEKVEVEEGQPESNENRPAVEVKKEEDDLSDYSDTVKKRIAKLTKKFRDEEKQRAAALEFAESVKKQNDELKAKLDKLDTTYVGEFDTRVQSQAAAAKEAYRKAYEAGDADAMYEAQQTISRIALEEARLQQIKQQREEQAKAAEVDGSSPPQQPTPTPPPPKPDPRAEEWAQKNEWFGQDQTMTYAAFGIHKSLIEEEGLDPNTEEYYTELDTRIKTEFPHKFGETKKSSGPRVASAGATASKSVSPKGRRTVKLTPSQIAIAKRLNVPLEEYAKYVKE